MNYHQAIIDLRKKHGLSFCQNPGGGEFNHPVHGRCQVYLWDDKDDYKKLMAWLIEKGLETS